MRTLEECKVIIAYKYGQPDWDFMIKSLKQGSDTVMVSIIDELCELYASDFNNLIYQLRSKLIQP